MNNPDPGARFLLFGFYTEHDAETGILWCNTPVGRFPYATLTAKQWRDAGAPIGIHVADSQLVTATGWTYGAGVLACRFRWQEGRGSVHRELPASWVQDGPAELAEKLAAVMDAPVPFRVVTPSGPPSAEEHAKIVADIAEKVKARQGMIGPITPFETRFAGVHPRVVEQLGAAARLLIGEMLTALNDAGKADAARGFLAEAKRLERLFVETAMYGAPRESRPGYGPSVLEETYAQWARSPFAKMFRNDPPPASPPIPPGVSDDVVFEQVLVEADLTGDQLTAARNRVTEAGRKWIAMHRREGNYKAIASALSLALAGWTDHGWGGIARAARQSGKTETCRLVRTELDKINREVSRKIFEKLAGSDEAAKAIEGVTRAAVKEGEAIAAVRDAALSASPFTTRPPLPLGVDAAPDSPSLARLDRPSLAGDDGRLVVDFEDRPTITLPGCTRPAAFWRGIGFRFLPKEDDERMVSAAWELRQNLQTGDRFVVGVFRTTNEAGTELTFLGRVHKGREHDLADLLNGGGPYLSASRKQVELLLTTFLLSRGYRQRVDLSGDVAQLLPNVGMAGTPEPDKTLKTFNAEEAAKELTAASGEKPSDPYFDGTGLATNVELLNEDEVDPVTREAAEVLRNGWGVTTITARRGEPFTFRFAADDGKPVRGLAANKVLVDDRQDATLGEFAEPAGAGWTKTKLRIGMPSADLAAAEGDVRLVADRNVTIAPTGDGSMVEITADTVMEWDPETESGRPASPETVAAIMAKEENVRRVYVKAAEAALDIDKAGHVVRFRLGKRGRAAVMKSAAELGVSLSWQTTGDGRTALLLVDEAELKAAGVDVKRAGDKVDVTVDMTDYSKTKVHLNFDAPPAKGYKVLDEVSQVTPEIADAVLGKPDPDNPLKAGVEKAMAADEVRPYTVIALNKDGLVDPIDPRKPEAAIPIFGGKLSASSGVDPRRPYPDIREIVAANPVVPAPPPSENVSMTIPANYDLVDAAGATVKVGDLFGEDGQVREGRLVLTAGGYELVPTEYEDKADDEPPIPGTVARDKDGFLAFTPDATAAAKSDLSRPTVYTTPAKRPAGGYAVEDYALAAVRDVAGGLELAPVPVKSLALMKSAKAMGYAGTWTELVDAAATLSCVTKNEKGELAYWASRDDDAHRRLLQDLPKRPS